MKCTYMSDDGNDICCNPNSPYRADFCPVWEFQDVCKHAEERPTDE